MLALCWPKPSLSSTMASNPQCAALAAAKDKAGTPNIQNSSSVGSSLVHRIVLLSDRPKDQDLRAENHRQSVWCYYIYPGGLSIYDLVCTGAAVPTEAEFQAITVVLGVQDKVRIPPIPEIDA